MTDAFGTVWYGDEPPDMLVDVPDDADYQVPYEWKAKLTATFDSKTGAAYISFNPNPVSKTVTSDKAVVNLDYDANGNLVGIEVLL